MKPFRRSRLRRPAVSKLGVLKLEDRAVPSAAAVEAGTVTVGFRTYDPADPVTVRSFPVAAGRTTEQAIAQWARNPTVAFAEPTYVYQPQVVADDPYAGLLYGQNNSGQSGGVADADMDAAEAWDLTTGSLRTVVGVIDTGVDYTHPDLYRNVWINQAEIPASVRTALTDVDGDALFTFWDLNSPANVGPGKATDLNLNGYIDGGDLLKPLAAGGWADGADEGGNGYVDDLLGWDFVGNDNDPMDVVAEGGGHGTHVAGTIGAVGGNGVGVAGVAWQTRLMAVRFLGPDGGTSADAAASVRYAAANGAVVSNNSWGGGGYSEAIYDAIAYARTRGHVFVAAAGNSAADNDTTASYPTNYALDNVVAVAATDRNDRLASFSNYGRTTVDLAAAGVDIVSTYPGDRYVYMSGTSMASPQVTGAFALLLGREPGLSYADAIGRVLGGVDQVGSLSTTTATGGRLNARRALAVPGPQVESIVVNDGPVQRSQVRSLTVTFSGPVTFAGDPAAAFTLTRLGDGGTVDLRAVASDADGRTRVTLTFAGGTAVDLESAAEGALSLADGRYRLAVADGAVTGLDGWALDGDGDGVAGGGFQTADGDGPYRLYGDATGDGLVDLADLGLFRGAFNSGRDQAAYLDYLDADGNGAIDLGDLNHFRSRFNRSVV